MHALILYACVTGTHCPPFVLTDQIPSQFACMIGAQPEIAKFLSDRPKWKVEGYRCVDVRHIDEFIGQREA